jgi:hypothetical protein
VICTTQQFKHKAYIPAPEEYELVANTTIHDKTLKKEVITTSNKAKKVVAPATKTAPVAAAKKTAGAKKGGGKRG